MDANGPLNHSKIMKLLAEDFQRTVKSEHETSTTRKPTKRSNLSERLAIHKIKKWVIGKIDRRKGTESNRVAVISNNAMESTQNETDTARQRKTSKWQVDANKAKELLWWNPPENKDFFEFCQDTSLHGLKYIGQQNRHLSERIFWLIAFLSGLVLAIVLINDVWNKYNSSPIIVSFDTKPVTIDQLPFPAITICNMNKVLKSKADEYLEKAFNGEPRALENVYYLDHVCGSTQSFTSSFNYEKNRNKETVQGLLKDFDSSNLTKVNTFLGKASQNCSDMIPLCIWQDETFVNCSTLFRPIETEFGKCCTFNMIPQSELYKLRNDSRDDEKEILEWQEWNKESATDVDGILLKGYKGSFPRRQMESGKSFGLSLLLNPRLEEYFCTSSDSTGFRLTIHWNTEIPRVTDYGISIRTKGELLVDVKPDITLSDATVMKFDVDTRQCYKIGEFPLQYFHYYTSRNCVDECIANETMRLCKCKRYFMPRSDNQRLCGGNLKGIECAEGVKLNMTRYGAKTECKHCLPSCSEIGFSSQTTATPLQNGIWEYSKGEKSKDLINPNVSIVHVFYGQDATYAKIRKELFGSTDLFANTGGLMGLCLGFSGLSLMEVIYFFTLRAWWASRRKEEIRKRIVEKTKAAWQKLKNLNLRIIWNGPAALNKQAAQEEKVGIGNHDNLRSNYKLHMSPVYGNRVRVTPIQMPEVDVQSERKEEDKLPAYQTQVQKPPDYKSFLGEL